MEAAFDAVLPSSSAAGIPASAAGGGGDDAAPASSELVLAKPAAAPASRPANRFLLLPLSFFAPPWELPLGVHLEIGRNSRAVAPAGAQPGVQQPPIRELNQDLHISRRQLVRVRARWRARAAAAHAQPLSMCS